MDSVIELCLCVHAHTARGRYDAHACTTEMADELITLVWWSDRQIWTQTPRLPYVLFPINQDKMADGAGSLDAMPSDA